MILDLAMKSLSTLTLEPKEWMILLPLNYNLLFVIVSWLLILPLGNSVYFTAKRGMNDVSFFIYLFTDMSTEWRSILSTNTRLKGAQITQDQDWEPISWQDPNFLT